MSALKEMLARQRQDHICGPDESDLGLIKEFAVIVFDDGEGEISWNTAFLCASQYLQTVKLVDQLESLQKTLAG